MKLCYAAGYLRLGVDGPGGGGLHVEGGVVARPAAGETIPDTELWADAELRHQAGRRQPHGGTWTRPAGPAGGGDRRRRNLLMFCIIWQN